MSRRVIYRRIVDGERDHAIVVSVEEERSVYLAWLRGPDVCEIITWRQKFGIHTNVFVRSELIDFAASYIYHPKSPES